MIIVIFSLVFIIIIIIWGNGERCWGVLVRLIQIIIDRPVDLLFVKEVAILLDPWEAIRDS